MAKHGKTDAETVTIHNEAIRGYRHNAELASKMRSELGFRNDKIGDAVTLNMLDDLALLHQKVQER